jgi:zinc protease
LIFAKICFVGGILRSKLTHKLAMLMLAAAVVICGSMNLGAQTKSAAPEKKAPSGKKAAAAAGSSVDIPIPDIKYTKFVLKNGLTVLVHEDHKAPIVAVNTWYHVGSKNEKPGKTGFAHLFEHLMFNGSENFNHTYLQAMETVGATNLNGTTNNDRTNYFENMPKSMLDYALFAESDRMGHLLPVLDQKKLDLQRGVVQNEKRQGENQPYGVAEELIVKNTYPAGHPYSWTVIGEMSDLDAASMNDVQEWFKTYYGPNNTTLVIAGDITPEEARQKVEKYYGEIPPGPPIAKQEAWIAKRTGTHRGFVQDRVPQARVYRIWNVSQFGAPDTALLDLVEQVLGRGKTSRLYRRLVYKDQIATNATASNDDNEIGGQFDFTLTARPDVDIHKVEKAADEELQNFLKNGPTEAELQLAKTQIFGSYARIVERIGGFGGKSDLLARCQTYTGDGSCYKTYLQRIKDATPAAVKKAANDWLSDGDYILEVQPYPANLKAEGKLDRAHEPAPGAPVSLNLPPMQKATLSNGLKVVLAERHTAPVVNFSLLVDSGYAADPSAAPGTASFSQRMLEEGTPTRDSLKIGEELESLSANFGAGANLDWANVNLNTLKLTMDKALDIYADLILHPAFPEKEFKRLQADRIAAIRREKVQPQSMALRVVPQLLYGKGHPYSLPFTGSGTEASVSKLTPADLAKWHDTWFKPNNATLLIVGDITLAEIKPKLEKLFAGWKPGDVPKKNVTTVAAPEKNTVYLIDRPGSGQSVIFGAQLAPPRNDPASIPLQLVNDIFGGNFSSRINMNLREDKGYTYGASSAFSFRRGAGPFTAVAPVQGFSTKESVVEFMKELRGIRGEIPVTQAELDSAKQSVVRGFPRGFETPDQIAAQLEQVVTYDLPDTYFNSYLERIQAVTLEDVSRVANRYLQPDRMAVVIVGDRSKIEQGLRSLDDLGNRINLVDADGHPAAQGGATSGGMRQ